MKSLSELFGFNQEEETEEPEVETTPEPQYATIDQMQQMVEGVAAKLQENLLGYTQQTQRQEQQPQSNFQWIEEPSMDLIQEAYDEGDTKKALQLQAQREAAREQRYQVQLAQLRHEGQQWVSGVNSKLVDTSVPDFKKYEKDVDELFKELGLPKESKSNLRLLELVTNAVKGGKIDEILAERMEAKKRQENLETVAEPTGGRRNIPKHEEPAFTSQELLALKANGIDGEQFAKKRGYGDWSSYEKQKRAYDAASRGEGNYQPKWRRALQGNK